MGFQTAVTIVQADLAEGGTGERQGGPVWDYLGGLQGRAGRERGLGQVPCSKAEQLDGLRARDEREPSLGQVQGSKADHLDGLRGRDR